MTEPQSTNHLFMVNPVVFFSNPETQGTNRYQKTAEDVAPDILLERVRDELSVFIDKLRERGVKVTQMDGSPECPDHIFPGNWVSTHPDKTAVYYPMLAPNRRAERTKEICDFLEQDYKTAFDYAGEAENNRFLEGTGSFTLDRVNKIAYLGISPRSDKSLAEQWAKDMGYQLVAFNTEISEDYPVYHTDLIMFIGQKVAGVCFDCIDDNEKAKVREVLEKTHDIIELSFNQMQDMCGNALEVLGTSDTPYLMMSTRAYNALTEEQIAGFKTYYSDIIHSPMTTIENYGGGSARCLILELF